MPIDHASLTAWRLDHAWMHDAGHPETLPSAQLAEAIDEARTQTDEDREIPDAE